MQIPPLSEESFRMMHFIMSDNSKIKKILIRAGVIAIWLLLWQIASLIVKSDFLFPSPIGVFKRFIELAGEKAFWIDCLSTLGRILLSCVSGVAVGTLLGIITAVSKPLYELFSPLLILIKTTPVASFIILVLVWIRRSNVPIFIGFLMVVPIMWANVSQGIKNADIQKLEMAKIFGFSKTQTMKMIYFPEVMPSFTAGCTTAIGLSWKAGVAAEVLATPENSVGAALYFAKINLEYADLFAWTAAIIIMSFIIEKIFTKSIRRLLSGRER